MDNTSGFTPVDVRVLIKPDPVEERTKGGIILADTTKDRNKYAATKGTLVAKGRNAFVEWGSEQIQVGDRVLFAQYAGSRFTDATGDEWVVMNDEDIVARAAQ